MWLYAKDNDLVVNFDNIEAVEIQKEEGHFDYKEYYQVILSTACNCYTFGTYDTYKEAKKDFDEIRHFIIRKVDYAEPLTIQKRKTDGETERFLL